MHKISMFEIDYKVFLRNKTKICHLCKKEINVVALNCSDLPSIHNRKKNALHFKNVNSNFTRNTIRIINSFLTSKDLFGRYSGMYCFCICACKRVVRTRYNKKFIVKNQFYRKYENTLFCNKSLQF